jgi:DNA-binding NtrC family response regulator
LLQQSKSISSIVLFGLSATLGAELGKALMAGGHTVHTYPFLPAAEYPPLLKSVRAGLVFCAADAKSYPALLEAIKQTNPALPVVVVSRLPEVTEWLNALEAGASDYCAPPFESTNIGWILDAAVRDAAGRISANE